jgi:hypothetical protein
METIGIRQRNWRMGNAQWRNSAINIASIWFVWNVMQQFIAGNQCTTILNGEWRNEKTKARSCCEIIQKITEFVTHPLIVLKDVSTCIWFFSSKSDRSAVMLKFRGEFRPQNRSEHDRPSDFKRMRFVSQFLIHSLKEDYQHCAVRCSEIK